MKFKPIYFFGSVLLFLGFFWMFLPHIVHESAAEKVDDSGHGGSSHYENLIYGVILVLTGLFL